MCIPIASIIVSLVTFIASRILEPREELLVFGITCCVVTVFAQIIMRKRLLEINYPSYSEGPVSGLVAGPITLLRSMLHD